MFERIQDRVDRLSQIIDATPDARAEYLTECARRDQHISALRRVIALEERDGRSPKWLLDPEIRDGLESYDELEEAAFWPTKAQMKKRGRKALKGLFFVPYISESEDLRWMSGRYVEVCGQRFRLIWDYTLRPFLFLLEAIYYCPDMMCDQDHNHFTGLDDSEITPAFLQEGTIPAYALLCEHLAVLDRANVAYDRKTRNDPLLTVDGVATILSDQWQKIILKHRAKNKALEKPTPVQKKMLRDKIYMFLFASFRGGPGEYYREILWEICRHYPQEALDFLVSRMKHHLLDGALGGVLPLAPSADPLIDFGPTREAQFERVER